MPHYKGIVGTGANFVQPRRRAQGRGGTGEKRREPSLGEPLMGSPTDHKMVYVGLDVGSTTVKAVVVDPETDEILWRTTSATRPSSRRSASSS